MTDTIDRDALRSTTPTPNSKRPPTSSPTTPSPPQQRTDRGSHLGCIAGALSASEYHDGLTDAGLANITITPTHAVADGFHSAIIQAHKTG